jgi:hypothetical protein
MSLEHPQVIQIAGTNMDSHWIWCTSSHLLGSLILLSGPAGLILAREFKRTKKTRAQDSGEETVPESMPLPQS